MKSGNLGEPVCYVLSLAHALAGLPEKQQERVVVVGVQQHLGKQLLAFEQVVDVGACVAGARMARTALHQRGLVTNILLVP